MILENKDTKNIFGNIPKIAVGIILILLMTSSALGAPWWDTSRHFRLPITVSATGYERYDKPVELNINFTQFLKSTSLDERSIRIVEINSVGTILNSSVQFQFDKDPGYNPTTKASGTIVFIMKGMTTASAKRYYHIYFNSTGRTYSTIPVIQLVTLTDNIIDQGQSSYKVNNIGSTYYFQKQAGGFSSWNDKSGNDWIGWSTASGSAGKYRGIPNAVNPEGIFHPGFYCCTSSIISRGPIKIKIRSTSNDGKWESIWEFYPNYATMTMTKKGHNYWFLVEGTPGGLFEPNKDFMVRSNGVKTLLSQSWTGDIANNEWVYFSDPTVGRSLFAAHREDDTLQDEYWGYNYMTVFGFGRKDAPLTQYLNYVPQHFTIGLIDGTDFTKNAKTIFSAYKDLTVTKGTIEKYNPTSITIVSPNGGENWAKGSTHAISWTKTGNSGQYVKVELYKTGVLNRIISSNTSNDGSYSWAIPSVQTIGSDYKVKVISISNSIYNDWSNNYFKIY